jgi:hypothetical protein
LTTKERRIKSLFNYIIYQVHDMMNTSKSDERISYTHTHTHTHTDSMTFELVHK